MMIPIPAQPRHSLRAMIQGFRVTQAIYAAVTLGIPDLLANGPRSSDELGAASSAHPETLYRLLRALASIGIFEEHAERRFSLTEFGTPLRSDVPESLAGWAAFLGSTSQWDAWGGLLHSVRTGENAFRHVHGVDLWTFRAQNPNASIAFDNAMTSLARQVTTEVLAAFDFSRFGTIVDVGGGNGAFLAAILSANPAVRGVLFDLPHVVAGAPALLEAAGVAERCEIRSGSFFEGVPEGGDAYLLKSILHDWEDDDCVRILQSCRHAMREGSALLVVERDLGRPNADAEAKFSDLNMLVAPGGRERSPEHYARLFEAAGFGYGGFSPSPVSFGVFEGVAVA